MSRHATPQLAADDATTKSMLGFWIYLMTDCILFATLFATYMVLQNGTYGGPAGRDIFDLPFVLVETVILLTSSFICGLALLAARAGKLQLTLLGFGAVGALGLLFISMELYEFTQLVHEGYDWRRSGFLSAFFTLVGTHGLHIIVGLLWLVVLLARIVTKGFSASMIKRLALFSMFWHFLDIIWIFIFTIVYLMGVL